MEIKITGSAQNYRVGRVSGNTPIFLGLSGRNKVVYRYRILYKYRDQSSEDERNRPWLQEINRGVRFLL